MKHIISTIFLGKKNYKKKHTLCTPLHGRHVAPVELCEICVKMGTSSPLSSAASPEASTISDVSLSHVKFPWWLGIFSRFNVKNPAKMQPSHDDGPWVAVLLGLFFAGLQGRVLSRIFCRWKKRGYVRETTGNLKRDTGGGLHLCVFFGGGKAKVDGTISSQKMYSVYVMMSVELSN